MNAKLYFESEKLVLQFGGQTIDIPLSVAKLQARFTPYPPSEMAWEEAIMQVEDVISPYRDVLKDYRVIELYHAEPLQILADENRQISTEIFETAFAVLAGYRPTRDLPKLAHHATSAAFVLVMREWMHHLGFEAAAIAD